MEREQRKENNGLREAFVSPENTMIQRWRYLLKSLPTSSYSLLLTDTSNPTKALNMLGFRRSTRLKHNRTSNFTEALNMLGVRRSSRLKHNRTSNPTEARRLKHNQISHPTEALDLLGFRRSRRLKHTQTAAASEPINKKKLCAELFTDDLIAEILSWLPPKFAGRCKVVCKSWQAIIESRYFIEQHMQRQKPIIVDPIVVDPQQPFVDLYYLRGLSLEGNPRKGSSYRIRNYATKQVFELPDLNERRIFGSMCHLPTSDEYKVLNLHWKENDSDIGLKVLTKGTDVTWRCVDISPLLSLSKNNDEYVHSKTRGTVCYIMKFSKSGLSKMIAFQVQDERFVEISLPGRLKCWSTGSPFSPMTCDSNVSIGGFVGDELHVWVLKDYKISKWDERKIALPSALLRKYPRIVERIPYSMKNSKNLIVSAPDPPFLELYNIETASFSRMRNGLKPSLVRL